MTMIVTCSTIHVKFQFVINELIFPQCCLTASNRMTSLETELLTEMSYPMLCGSLASILAKKKLSASSNCSTLMVCCDHKKMKPKPQLQPILLIVESFNIVFTVILQYMYNIIHNEAFI